MSKHEFSLERRNAIDRPIEPADDWIWFADHSNQIGQEKVLSVLGIRACHLPPPGRPLRHEDVRVLDLVVGSEWKREDMTEVYEQLAERCGGPPLALIADGAVELREGAEPLKKQRETMLVLRDFKHLRGQRAEENHRRRRTIPGIRYGTGPHALGDSANRTGPFHAAESQAQSAVHESRADTAVVGDAAVASVLLSLGIAARDHGAGSRRNG